MARFELRLAVPPYRRIAVVDSDTDPDDAAACVLLLRRLASVHRRKPEEVILRVPFGRKRHDYHV